MGKKKALVVLLSCTLIASAFPTQMSAEAKTDVQEDGLSMEGYELKWEDNFDGDTLNRDYWNVETHEAGWVNSELQEYVDSEKNIYLKDGSLHLNPIKTSEATEEVTQTNLIKNADFSAGMDNWVETIANWGGDYVTEASSSTANGAIKYEINNPGTEDWHVQLKQQGISLEEGKTYVVSYDVTSTASRTIKSGVMSTSYEWYGGSDPVLTENVATLVTFEFTMQKTDNAADFYISLGKCGDTPAGTVTISNIKFVDKNEEAKNVTSEKCSYTSGRISTQNKETFTYGLFECRAKVPVGQGFLPAFWLMANDENIYGQWPRCGEIDCMEVMGQDTKTAYGTIHYGNPHEQSQGTYTLSDSDFANEFHTFACEWEPGAIRWYVDGKLYHEETYWYSATEGQGTLTYPAPFDQPFYIILNLAVGGSWVGNPDSSTSFDNNQYVIDYVKVYQKESYDDSSLERPVKTTTLREPDENGNYINNGDFATKEDLTDDKDWKFLTANSGVGNAEIADNTMIIKTENDGTVDYSIQLVQPEIPLVKGATYEISFEAYASEDREMGVDVKAPDHGYITYMDHQTAKLTTTKQTYTYTFTMKSDTDGNGRLEYNMGATGSTADIYISNVSLKKVSDADPNAKEEKTVRANGNYIYNGTFSEGTGHLGYWNITKTETAKNEVTSFADGRRLNLTLGNGDSFTLAQEELAIKSGMPYQFTADIEAENEGKLKLTVGGETYIYNFAKGENKCVIDIPAGILKNTDITLVFNGENEILLDNLFLAANDNALIKNGSFIDGTTNYTVYIDSSAKASYAVDSLKNDNALDVTITDTGDADWKVQVKQENVKLEQGKKYLLTYKAKSSIDRSIRVIMQGQEDKNWQVYSSTEENPDGIVSLTDEYKNYSVEFTMNAETDEKAFLSICLGQVDTRITDNHNVTIDDISLVEVKEEEKETETNETKNESENIQTQNTESSNVAVNNEETTKTTKTSTPEVTPVTVQENNKDEKVEDVTKETEKTTNKKNTENKAKVEEKANKEEQAKEDTKAEEQIETEEKTEAEVAETETTIIIEEETPASEEILETVIPQEETIPVKTGFFAGIGQAIVNFFKAIFTFFANLF